jgi:hypothetical protein
MGFLTYLPAASLILHVHFSSPCLTLAKAVSLAS